MARGSLARALIQNRSGANRHEGTPQPAEPPEVTLRAEGAERVAEARLTIAAGHLVVGLDAGPFHRRLRRLRQEFAVFASVLALAGIFLSWLLYRVQQAHL